MNRFMPVLLGVWREACQHIEIAEATALIAPRLAEHLPLGLVAVRKLDPHRPCIETVGTGLCGEAGTPLPTRHDLAPGELDELLRWCRERSILRVQGTQTTPLARLLVPAHFSGDVLAGPLTSATGPTGVLLLVAKPGRAFEPGHAALFEALLEPFSVAVDNDQRLREMQTLREAAEADKRSLLTRLGRQEISDTIVGMDGGLRQVMERVALVSRSDVPVLILGETGSGKEVVARAIHGRSERAAGPFLRVNCGAIPPELIDSELFGHEKGSFTGAVSTRKGWFERADHGTLFLDEIGELPPAAQVRLLRILQDGTFERVGGQHQLKVDVRIVAATHRDMKAMVTDGRFREDLWYRVAVFPIHLPALRERPEDIPALATHLAVRAARRFGLPVLVPSREDINLLLAYSWPGNVRELAAVIDRAAILGDGQTLQIAKALGAPSARPASVVPATPAPAETPGGPISSLDDAMRMHIEKALRVTHGRVEGRLGAARLLGINPHTLRARMRKLGIAWERFRPQPLEVPWEEPQARS